MGFWIFMMIMDVIIPLTMIVIGCYFIKKAPKKINLAFGYRTTMSMKNKDTWEIAHHYSGLLWRAVGLILLIVTIIAMPFSIGKTEDFVGAFGGILCGIQLVFLVASIFPVEIALKKTFDENGLRRK